NELEEYVGDDAERALRPDEQVLHRVPRDVLDAGVAKARDLAARQHHLEGHDVIARDAVLQSAQTTRIFGDVPTDRADTHRPGIRRIEQPVLRRRFVNRLGDHARLRADRQVLWIDGQDAIHLRQAQHHASFAGDAAAAEAG